jgi:hypothetical protein
VRKTWYVRYFTYSSIINSIHCQKAVEEAAEHAKAVVGRQRLHDKCSCVMGADIHQDDIYKKSVAYLRRSSDDRNQWAIEVINAGSNNFSSGAPHNLPLCKLCFPVYHCIAPRTFQRRLSEVKQGVTEAKRGRSKRRKKSSPLDSTEPWLLHYAKRNGDNMPDVYEIHLPDYKWKWVYKKMQKDFSTRVPATACPSYDYFMKFRKTDACRHVKIRKLKRFAKCKECTNLELLIKKASGPQKERLRQELQDHHAWQKEERAKYYKHREKSRFSLNSVCLNYVRLPWGKCPIIFLFFFLYVCPRANVQCF